MPIRQGVSANLVHVIKMFFDNRFLLVHSRGTGFLGFSTDKHLTFDRFVERIGQKVMLFSIYSWAYITTHNSRQVIGRFILKIYICAHAHTQKILHNMYQT